MIDRLDQIFVLLKHWLAGLFACSIGRPPSASCSALSAIVGLYPALFALTTVLERKGWGASRIGWARIASGPFGILAAGRGRHQVADQGRHCSAQRGCGSAFSRADRAGGHGVHGLCGAAHGPQHGAGGYGCRPAVLFRHGRVDGTVGLHGGLVEPQQVFAAGRHARHCADDQLRSGAAAVERGRSS